MRRFAFDTEFVSEETFEPVLCLIQVATRERLAVIDPLAVRDVGPFWEVVLDPAMQVVMHASGEDLRICMLRTGSLPRRVFDVQVAAGLVGYNYPLSLVNLVGQVKGVSLSGSETRTDWRHRPLTGAQVRYALDDVRHLLDLADQFTERLVQLGRTEWANAEFNDLLESIAERADLERWRQATGTATTRPQGSRDGPAARGMARKRGKAAKPPPATGRARRPSSGHRQAPASQSP